MADAMDSKSIVRKGVRVRVPPRALLRSFPAQKEHPELSYGWHAMACRKPGTMQGANIGKILAHPV